MAHIENGRGVIDAEDIVDWEDTLERHEILEGNNSPERHAALERDLVAHLQAAIAEIMRLRPELEVAANELTREIALKGTPPRANLRNNGGVSGFSND